MKSLSLFLCLSACAVHAISAASATFTVATYNVENYVDTTTGNRQPKSADSKAKVRQSVLAMKPDVLALQEMGTAIALLELRATLKAEGLDYPHWEHVTGYDTNIYVAVLSRFPITGRRSHTNEAFLLSGRRFRTSRGFAEVDIQVTPSYRFTLFTAHLKSRRQVFEADEAELREQEALILRELVDARLKANASANIVLLGDFNDVKDSRSTRVLIGRGRSAFVDTRPAERNGDNAPNPNPRFEPRNITWTHYYGKEDTYSRVDYILLSPGIAKEWDPSGTFVLALPNWGVASDHRPVIARFTTDDK